MLAIIRRWLSAPMPHRCEEWEQWQDCYVVTSRQTTVEQRVIPGAQCVTTQTRHRGVQRWQERRCTLCGRIEQEGLRWGTVE